MDKNIKLSAVQWLLNYIERENWSLPEDIAELAKKMEEKQLKDGMMYALDEDGHTGEWKHRFVNTYYEQMYG